MTQFTSGPGPVPIPPDPGNEHVIVVPATQQPRRWPVLVLGLLMGLILGAGITGFVLYAKAIHPMGAALGEMGPKMQAMGQTIETLTKAAGSAKAPGSSDSPPPPASGKTDSEAKPATAPRAGVYIGDPTKFSRGQLRAIVAQAGRQHQTLGILMPWRVIEARQGTYKWGPYATIDQLVTKQNSTKPKQKVSLSIDIIDAPAWAAGSCKSLRCAPTAAHVSDYASFATTVAGRYSTAAAPASINVWHHANRKIMFAGGSPARYAAL